MFKSGYSSAVCRDDTNLTVAGESIQEIELNMNSDLACINEWLLANKLSLNVTKTEFILIGSAHKLNNLVTQPGAGCIKLLITFLITIL
jgi:hypothetical protein